MSDPESSTSPNGGPAVGDLDQPRPGGPPPNIQKLVASKRLQQAQAQVGEVVDIMRVNVEKVLERDQKISELDRRADDLQEGASQFQQHAVKLKRKYWWENIKMWIIIGVILLAVVIIVVVTTTQKDGSAASGQTTFSYLSPREFLLRNGVGNTCLWRKYILPYEYIQKRGKKNFQNSTLALGVAT